MAPVSLGQRVNVRGEPGVVRFFGSTQFASGHWVGVELDSAKGRNDGSVQGVKYFECEKAGNSAVFIRAEALEKSVPGSPGSSAGPDVKAVVNKLQVKLKAAVAEIGKSKQTIETLNSELASSQRQQEQLEESLEHATVDVEYLRSHNTELIESLESLREKYEHLSADYSIVNEELEFHKELETAVSSSAPSGPVSIEDFQILLQHNKKLELALTSLQKVSEEAHNSKAETLKLLSKKSSEFAALDKSYQALTQKLDASGETIAQLQEELELSAESASIIDHLTSENETLQAKIAELTRSVNELTELHEMDKNIEENHVLVEQEFRTLVEKLKSEISGHKKHLDKLQSTNNLLVKESSDLKKKLAYDEKQIHAQELEQILLESKKLKSRDSQNAFIKALLQGNIESISDLYGQLVPEKYQSQIKMILLAKKCLASCSSILSHLEKLPTSSLSFKSVFLLREFASSLMLLKHIAEYAHYNSAEENERIESLICRSNANLDKAISSFVPTDLYSLDLTLTKESVEFTNKLSGQFTISKSTEADYICSYMTLQIDTFFKVSKELSSTYFEGSSEFQTLNQELIACFEEGRLLKIEIDKQRKLLSDHTGQEMIGNFPVTINALAVGPLFIDLFKNVESEIGLDDAELAEKITSFSLDLPSITCQFKEMAIMLSKQLEFKRDDRKSVYQTLIESADGGNEEALKARSEMESQLVEKTRRIQDLCLQIELLEKNMSSTLSGKESELLAARNLLSDVQKECQRLKEQSDDLLQVNKDLSSQLDVLRSVDHFAEYQQVPAFEDLKSMRDYTSTMALIDEINLLKRMVRYGGNSSQDIDDNWLYEPLTDRKKNDNAVAGAMFLQTAQKKRREALLISQTILSCSKQKSFS